jgi:hypothetical protein
MAGGIWEALGAALQQGVGTYNNVNQFQQEAEQRKQRMLMEQQEMELRKAEAQRNAERFAMEQERFGIDKTDRSRKILEEAIVNKRPDEIMSADLIGQIQSTAPDLMERLSPKAGALKFSGAQQGLGPATEDNPLGLSTTPFEASQDATTFSRRATPQEEAQRLSLEAGKAGLEQTKQNNARAQAILDGLAKGTIKDTPANRAMIAQYTQANPNELWGTIEHPSRAGGSGGLGAGNLGATADAIIANPHLWSSVTPTLRAKLIPVLNARGFDFQTSMNPTGIKAVAEGQAAISGAQQLETDLREDAGASSGPIKGYAGLLPDIDLFQQMFGTRDVRKMQGAIDLVKQRVGKLLEGGVLRKEDELKYAKILPTVYDGFEVQMAKMANVRQTLERDLALYMEQQNLAGKRTAPTTAQIPGGTGTRGPVPANTQPVAPSVEELRKKWNY